jgi:D-glycero-alpha-D-manno-heptose-7-phosphate kinase
LGLPEAISQKFNVRNGLKIFLAPQVPLGEGLGLTGSLAVSMIKALALCAGIDLEPQEVAEFACQVADSARTASPLKADPFASAYGGLNAIETKASQPIVKSIHLASDTREALEKSLMLFRIDSIDPSSVSSPARRRLSPYKAQLDYESDGHGSNGGEEVPDVDVVAALQHGDLVAFGHSLHRSWLEDPCGRIDRGHVLLDYYRIAREVGALGGRGEVASGHGFLVLCCREEDQGRVTDALVALGMKRWPLRLASEGVEVLEAIPRAWSKLTSTTSLLSAEAL